MLNRLLPLLVCPECHGDLRQENLLHGAPTLLVCKQCEIRYPIRNGIPRMLPAAKDRTTSKVVDGFSRQWQRYNEWRELYVRQFLGWIAPVAPDFFRGKLILDAGCGKGRHLRASADFGADLVVGMDLGESIDVAFEALRERPNVACVQGDLFKPPFRPGTFDYAFSIGVLHHTPDPRAAFASVLKLVRPGGNISAWVYGQENNAWLERYVAPVRNRITTHFSEANLARLATFLSLVLVGITRGLYRPLAALPLPYRDYMLVLSEYPRKEIESIIFDHLHPVLNAYIPRGEFESWFRQLEEVGIRWHNRNSWSGFARIPTKKDIL